MCLKIKLKYAFLTIFLSFGYYSFGQFLHTPEEMEEIVLNNPAKYMLQETDNLGSEAFSNCRQSNNAPQISASAPEFSIDNQPLSKIDKKKLQKKNKKIKKQLGKNNSSALREELVANHYRLGNYEEALYYKLQFADKLDFDFENEFFQAKAYLEMGEPKTAFDHIFNAKILMPYSEQVYTLEDTKKVETLLSEVLLAHNKSYQDWALQFSYCVANKDNRTFISFKSQPWKTYAICKTVWQEDSQHKTKMATISDQSSWLVEEKECLLNAFVSYLRHEENNPAFMGLQQFAIALENNYIEDFIQYEAFAARYEQNPEEQPSPKKIERLKAYFLRVHTSSNK